MKTAIALLTVLAAALLPHRADAQKKPTRGQPFNKVPQTIQAPRTETLSFHNPYTSGTVTSQYTTPGLPRPACAVVLVAGATAREQLAAVSLRQYLAEHGYAVMKLPPPALSGAREDDSLNTVAALKYLAARQDLRGVPVGLVGYGEGVRLAVTSASQGNPAAFLALLGGSVVSDSLNSLPDTLIHGALPKNEAEQSLAHVRCPILVLIGEYDRQGTHRTASANAQALKSILDSGKHQNYTIKIMVDSDTLLADTGPAGSSPSSTALPPGSVWKTATEWMNRQVSAADPTAAADNKEIVQTKPIKLYPKSVYGQFNYRPSMIWQPAIGGQTRPFGFWYW